MRMTNLAKDNNRESKYDEEDDSVQRDEEEVTYEDEGLSLVVKRLIYVQAKVNPRSQCHKIFRTRCTINERVCDVSFID